MSDRITVVGSLGGDPEERTTSKGSVVQLRLASSDRRRNAQGEWVDGPTSWYRVTAWGELGKNALASLKKGQRVIVAGELSISEWDLGDGHKGRTAEIRAVSLGHDLTFGRSTFERVPRASQPVQTQQPTAQQGSSEAGDGPRTAMAAVQPQPVQPAVDHSNDWGVPAVGDGAATAADAPDWATTPF